jgi:predicted DNA-binding ribbon-helix-helix protein
MKTSVVGIRLNDSQREQLKRIGSENKMTEGEIVRSMVESLLNGEINISRGKVVVPEQYDLSGLEKLAKRHKKTTQQIIDMISEME